MPDPTTYQLICGDKVLYEGDVITCWDELTKLYPTMTVHGLLAMSIRITPKK